MASQQQEQSARGLQQAYTSPCKPKPERIPAPRAASCGVGGKLQLSTGSSALYYKYVPVVSPDLLIWPRI